MSLLSEELGLFVLTSLAVCDVDSTETRLSFSFFVDSWTPLRLSLGTNSGFNMESTELVSNADDAENTKHK